MTSAAGVAGAAAAAGSLKDRRSTTGGGDFKKRSQRCCSRLAENITLPGFDRRTTRSLFVFGEQTKIRRAAKYIIEWSPFEYIILLTILANCVILSLEEHLPNGDRTALSKQLDETEPYFLAIYVVEAVLKIIALGFLLHRGSYLRNFWNIIDFVIVLTGFVSIFMSNTQHVLNLKTLRVLRPLKLVTGFSSLQIVLKSLLRAMAPLLQIGLLVLFSIIMFAIIGLEFYQGAFHSACYNNESVLIETEWPRPCSEKTSSNSFLHGYICPEGYECLERWEGPSYGIQSFDNIGLAMLTVFQVTTMAGWTSIWYCTDDAFGRMFNWIYFVPLIVIGAFFMLNLILGVLSGEFGNERERVENRRLFIKLRKQQALENQTDSYLSWICQAENVILSEERTTDEERARISRDRKAPSSSAFCLWWSQTYSRASYAVRRLIKSQFFYWCIILVVFFNTAFLAMKHYKEPFWLERFLYFQEFVFLSIFIVELLLKMFALGLREYFKSNFNKFDFAVICASVVEVLWQFYRPDMSFGISALRAMRLLRVFKITRYWFSLRNLVISLLNSMRSILSLLFLLFLFVVVFSLLGMQLFGGKWNFDEGRPDANFDIFSSALLTVFQILTGEDWDFVMFNGIRSYGGIQHGGMVYCLYFVVLIVFGNYTLLNIFLAIAVDNLFSAQELTAADEEADLLQNKNDEAAELVGAAVEGVQLQSGNTELPVLCVVQPPTPRLTTASLDVGPPSFDVRLSVENVTPTPSLDIPSSLGIADLVPNCATSDADKENVSKISTNNIVIPPTPILPYSALFIFSSTNPVRRFAHFIVTLIWFQRFVMLTIVAASVSLAAEDPVNYNATINLILSYLDYVFTAVFAIEMILKIIDIGLVLHPSSYLRNPWNVLDVIVVFCAIASLILIESGSANHIAIKCLHLIRVLRPIKMINRVYKLKLVFDSLLVSVRHVLVVMTVYLLLQIIFAIIGVHLFSGIFYACNDLSKETEEMCKGEYITYGSSGVAVTIPRTWTRAALHFDNLGASLLTLFTVQSRSDWPVVLQRAMDSTSVGRGPIPGYNSNMAAFFIVYFIIFPFFFVNIFVALIIVTFQQQSDIELADLDLDKNQKQCMEYAIKTDPINSYMPSNQSSVQFVIWKLIRCKQFEYLVLIMIGLNTLALMVKYYNEPQWYTQVLQYLNMAFTCVFTVEAIVKMIGYGPLNYLRQPWNAFDLIIVLGSIADVIITIFESSFVGLSILRLFRAARVIKLFQKSYAIRTLLWTFVQSIKALPYILLLIGILFFIYAIVGMQLFGDIKLNDETEINYHNNFRSFPDALRVLFRCSTLDKWVYIMIDCMEGVPCDPNSYPATHSSNSSEAPRCGLDFSIAYFVSFIFLSAFVLMNLFIAVIMDNFEYLTRDSSILGPQHLDEYTLAWEHHDRHATGRIHYTAMYEMLQNIEPPVGLGRSCPCRLAYKKLIRMNQPINIEDGTVDFKTTLFALIRDSLAIKIGVGSSVDSQSEDENDEELRRILRHLWPKESKKLLNRLVPAKKYVDNGKLTVGKIYAGLLIIDNWKNRQNDTFISDSMEVLTSLQVEKVSKLRRPSVFERIADVVTHSLSPRRSSNQKSADVGHNISAAVGAVSSDATSEAARETTASARFDARELGALEYHEKIWERNKGVPNVLADGNNDPELRVVQFNYEDTGERSKGVSNVVDNNDIHQKYLTSPLRQRRRTRSSSGDGNNARHRRQDSLRTRSPQVRKLDLQDWIPQVYRDGQYSARLKRSYNISPHTAHHNVPPILYPSNYTPEFDYSCRPPAIYPEHPDHSKDYQHSGVYSINYAPSADYNSSYKQRNRYSGNGVSELAHHSHSNHVFEMRELQKGTFEGPAYGPSLHPVQHSAKRHRQSESPNTEIRKVETRSQRDEYTRDDEVWYSNNEQLPSYEYLSYPQPTRSSVSYNRSVRLTQRKRRLNKDNQFQPRKEHGSYMYFQPRDKEMLRDRHRSETSHFQPSSREYNRNRSGAENRPKELYGKEKNVVNKNVGALHENSGVARASQRPNIDHQLAMFGEARANQSEQQENANSITTPRFLPPEYPLNSTPGLVSKRASTTGASTTRDFIDQARHNMGNNTKTSVNGNNQKSSPTYLDDSAANIINSRTPTEAQKVWASDNDARCPSNERELVSYVKRLRDVDLALQVSRQRDLEVGANNFDLRMVSSQTSLIPRMDRSHDSSLDQLPAQEPVVTTSPNPIDCNVAEPSGQNESKTPAVEVSEGSSEKDAKKPPTEENKSCKIQ